MLMTKEQYHQRKQMPEIQAHQWYGSDFIKRELSKHFDVYIDEDRAMFYVFPLFISS